MRIVLLSLVAAALILATGSLTHQTTEAVECNGPAQYSWDGTAIGYGIRDFAVTFCGGADLNITADVNVKGNKDVALVLVEPDNTVHVFAGSGDVSGEIQGPLANGEWTLIVRNLGSSRLKFESELTIE